jgi:hypothetical protein
MRQRRYGDRQRRRWLAMGEFENSAAGMPACPRDGGDLLDVEPSGNRDRVVDGGPW